MTSWSSDAVFYHIYPIGLLNAPLENPVEAPIESRLPGLASWAPHIREIGANAVYLGPVFESGTHGYDTVDYRRVDRRLGTNQDLTDLVATLHAQGIRVILDAVLNHVGRDFPQFRDLRERGEESPYRDWFANLRFGETNPFGDPFAYEGWSGHLNLVKLNLQNEDVRDELFGIVRSWFAEYDIDGLRLDAADVMDKDFLRDLAAVVREAKPDAWLMGEVVLGDYSEWAGPGMLDSVTNYEAFDALYKGLNARDLGKVAPALTRQFGPEGVYRGLPLYSFVDNHDVDRISVLLDRMDDLFPIHALLFTMPGVPSIYYASEWGYRGQKVGGNDCPLRPAFAWPVARETMECPDLPAWIARLSAVRHWAPALREGDFEVVHVTADQLVFRRTAEAQTAFVVVSIADDVTTLPNLATELPDATILTDALDPTISVPVQGGEIAIGELPARVVRIFLT